MTLDQLLIKSVILQFLLLILKVVFFGYLNMDLLPIVVVYYVIVAALGIAIVRRFGPLNYFEAFFLILVWIIIALLSDYNIIGAILGTEVFSDWHFWLSYLVIILSILIAHKKVHIEVRRGNMQR